jgi:hypothetical protein
MSHKSKSCQPDTGLSRGIHKDILESHELHIEEVLVPAIHDSSDISKFMHK